MPVTRAVPSFLKCIVSILQWSHDQVRLLQLRESGSAVRSVKKEIQCQYTQKLPDNRWIVWLEVGEEGEWECKSGLSWWVWGTRGAGKVKWLQNQGKDLIEFKKSNSKSWFQSRYRDSRLKSLASSLNITIHQKISVTNF